MNILNKLTLKHLALNKKRTIVSIIGIVLSTAMMVGIGLLMSSVRESMVNEVIDTNGSWNSQIKNVDGSKLDSIENYSSIKTMSYYYRIGYSKYAESTNEAKPYYSVISASKDFIDELKIVEGRLPENDTEIVLSNHIFTQGTSQYKVGDHITLEIGDRRLDDYILDDENYDTDEQLDITTTKTYEVVGIVRRSYYDSYSSAGFNIYTLAKDEDIKASNKLNLILTYKNPTDTVTITETIAKNQRLDDSINYISYNDSLLSLYGGSSYGNINSFLVSFLSVFLIIISVACIIVIYNSFAISVMERKKQFGLLSSIGATKKQIRKTVFYEAAFVGIIGIILGVLSAYLGIGIVIAIISNLMKDIIPGFVLTTYPLFIIIPIIFVIIVIMISAFIPAWQASRISPIEVIRQNDDIKINKRKIKTSKIFTKIFGVEGKIALKNVKRNKKKYRITIVSLFISIVTFMAFYTYLDYGTKTVKAYAGSFNFDIMINDSTESQNANEPFINHEDTQKYLTYYFMNHFIEKLADEEYTKEYLELMSNNEDTLNINVLALDNESYEEYKKIVGVKNDEPIIYNNSLSIDRTDGRKIKYTKVFKENKNMKFNFYEYTPDESEIKTLYELDNFIYTDKIPAMLNNVFENPILIISKKEFDNILSKTNETSSKVTLIAAKNQANLDKLGEKISNDAYYMNVTEEAKLQNNLLLTIEILFYGLLALITLIGVTSVFNTITTSINLRRKEFAVLRSIGLSPKGFNKMIWFESLMFGVKSLVYGLPVGCLLSYLISRSMDELVSNTFMIPLKPILICIVAVFLIVLITMWYATSKLKHENIIDTIRNENI